MKKEQEFDLFKSILIALVSGLTVVFVQQLFFKNNVDYEMKRNVLKENYEDYVALQNFADIGYYTVFKFELVFGQPKVTVNINSETNETIKIDSSFVYENNFLDQIKSPSIAIDKKRQDNWLKDKKYIMDNKNKIDQEIYLSFLEVVAIVEYNPFPQSTEAAELRKSVWSSEMFIQNWALKNMNLWSDVDDLIRIE